MSHDAPLSTEPSSPAAPGADDAASTVRLFTAGKHITMCFALELADLAEEIRELWAHVVDDGEAAPDALELRFMGHGSTDTGGAGQAAATSAPAYRLRPDDPGNSFIVSGRVTTALIRDMAGERILLHAGAVELPDLGTVLVVGPSGAGKSTSTAALGQNGTYLTDELSILDPEGFRVTAYPKPVSRVMERGEAHPSRSAAGSRSKSDIALSALTLEPGLHGTAPSHVLLLDRQPADERSAGGGSSAGPPVTAERTPTVEAVHTLSAQSSSTWRVDNGLARLMLLLDHCGGALTVRYREATDLVAQLPDLVTIPAHHPEWRHVPGRGSAAPGPGEYAITTFSDAVALAESFVVLRKGTLVSTQGLGALVWDILELSGPLTREALLAEIIDVLGENPQADELLDSALTSLLDERLIVHGGAAEE
ncbi:hypothetical protein [Brevibacterium yomogidense]|uniref:hypothetical protein n=1 Tax=Brevibacterium yomogidense TaxID=946573 RepID=UPI0018DEF4AC|nr:hypothetical protein [Brevibacterium yomogidense]